MAEAVPYEKLFPVVPLIGTSIAVFFDVGYFYGVGIDYFTLFSLTEHIGFALEALPIALAIATFALLTDAITELRWFRPSDSQIDASEGDEPLDGLTAATLRARIASLNAYISHQRWRLIKARILMALLLAGAVACFWYLRSFRTVVLFVAISVMVFVTMAAKRWYSTGAIPLLIIGCTVALLMGEFIGSSHVGSKSAPDSIVSKSGDTISANIIRSGERGVLYAKPESGIVEFTQWDAIKSISRSRKPSMFPD